MLTGIVEGAEFSTVLEEVVTGLTQPSQLSVQAHKHLIRHVAGGQDGTGTFGADEVSEALFRQVLEGPDARIDHQGFLAKRQPVFQWSGEDFWVCYLSRFALHSGASLLWLAYMMEVGSSRIRRYRLARDIPRSRATWVAGPRLDQPHRIADGGSAKVRRRPSGFLPAALRLTTESVIRSHGVSSCIWARAAMTVKTIEPIGVWVSTSPPPRFSTRNPASLPLSCSAKAGM